MEILYYNYKHFFTIWFPEIIYAKPTLELQTEDYKRFKNKNNIKTKLINSVYTFQRMGKKLHKMVLAWFL